MGKNRVYESSGYGLQDITYHVRGKRPTTKRGKVLVHNGKKVTQPTKRNRTLQRILGK